jgi:hypothetical protein
LLQQTDLRDDQIDDTMAVAKESVEEELKAQTLGGNLGGLMDMFNGRNSVNAGNPMVNAVIQRFIPKLSERLGVSPQMAAQVANMLIPVILSKFASKDTGEAKDEGDLIGKLGFDKDNSITDFMKGFGKGKSPLSGLGGLFN